MGLTKKELRKGDKMLLQMVVHNLKNDDDPPYYTGQTLASIRMRGNSVIIDPRNYGYLQRVSGGNWKPESGNFVDYRRSRLKINPSTGEVVKGKEGITLTKYYSNLNKSYAAKVNFITGGWSRRHLHWIEKNIEKNKGVYETMLKSTYEDDNPFI